MIHAIDLGNNDESEIKPEDLQTKGVLNVWLELVDPTEKEVQAVSQATQLPVNFLRLPKANGYINLRLEEGYSIINFMVMQDVVSTKKVHPVVLAFSKNFLVTVAQKEIQPIFNNAKERMSKPKIDHPSQVTYYILDEIVASHYVHIEKLENLTATIEEEVVEKEGGVLYPVKEEEDGGVLSPVVKEEEDGGVLYPVKEYGVKKESYAKRLYNFFKCFIE